jgi:hypothetical protein
METVVINHFRSGSPVPPSSSPSSRARRYAHAILPPQHMEAPHPAGYQLIHPI